MLQFHGDFCSQSVLNSAVRKLQPEKRPKWIIHVTSKGMLNPDLTYFSNWLSSIDFAHDELSLQFSEKSFQLKTKQQQKFQCQALAQTIQTVKQNVL